MQVQKNNMTDIIKVAAKPAGRNPVKGFDEAAGYNEFRHLMEEQQSAVQNSGITKQETGAAAEQNDLSGEKPFDADTDVNRQIMAAAMMAGSMPNIVQLDLQPEEQTAVDAVAMQGAEVLTSEQSAAEAVIPQQETVQPDVAEMPAEEKTAAASEMNQTKIAPEQVVSENEDATANVQGKTNTEKPAEKDGMEKTITAAQNPNAETPLFRTVDALPIRVGDASGTPEKVTVDIPQQLAKHLAQPIQGKISTVEMELNPKSLGKIRVEMEWMQDGSLHVSIKAEKAVAQTLLENSAGELQRMLEQDAQQMVRLEIQQAAKDELPNHTQDGRHQGQQNQERQNRDDDSESGNRFMQELRLGLAAIGG